ncbi:DMT family transporter [Defluviimonas sp. SAOS-178_SWC]|uniref:DMT family transporter n=1 Tax=Defluviimonas sp. SAOS-178_SWC TaxID=3121287 RepID=UPI003221A6A8
MSTATEFPAPRNPRLWANLACIASMAIWAVGFPLADALLATLPPLTVAVLRMALAALFLVPVWGLVEGGEVLRRVDWQKGLRVGAVGFGLGTWLLIFAQQRTDGITVAVIAATMPVTGIALECLHDGRRLNVRLVTGLILSIAGGVATHAARMGHLDMGLGALAAFASVVVFSWGSRASVMALPGCSALARSAVTLTGGAVALIIVQLGWAALGGDGIPWAEIGPHEWSYLAVYAIGSLALSQVLFLVGVAGLGIGVASMHINIAPFYVMLFALAFGAGWSWGQGVGAAVVALGVIIAQGRDRMA